MNAKLHARSTIGDRIRDAKNSSKEEEEEAKAEAKALKAAIASLQEKLDVLEEEMHAMALCLPNDTHPDVPIGPESAAITLSTHGPPRLPADPARDHLSIGRLFNLFDFEAGATVTGSSWYYLLNEAALLELALTQYVMSKALARSFTPVTTPDVVKADIAARCGFQPRDNNQHLSNSESEDHLPTSQMYHLQRSSPSHPELVLTGTAEIPLGGMCANRIYQPEELPLKYIGLGRAFRSEAGARGADTKGLYRVHQFTKLELFVVCAEDQSERLMKEILDLQLDIFSELDIPLRFVSFRFSLLHLLRSNYYYNQ